jgi:class 3 adenylate cyclase
LYFAYFFFTQNTEYKNMLATEREKSDRLLLSLFPDSIARKLRNSNQSVADSFDNVTILFADIVGFTQHASNISPKELVAMLDEIFSEFDALADKYGVEKIKTIGDSYMAVGGLPVPDENHCRSIADMALEINQVIKEKYTAKYNLKLRIGINTGQAVAGVIGNKKFAYDLWGDSVNIASRFEASGYPEKIHITQDVKNVLGDAYVYEDCGEIAIKGKGMMHSYFLLERKEVKTTSSSSSFSFIVPPDIANGLLLPKF